MINLVVAKLTSHHGRPSSTPRQRAILSLFLPQGWQFKGNGGRERALSCVQIILAGAGRMKGTLEHWSKKRLCSPEYGYVFPLLLLLFLKSFNYILCCKCLLYAHPLWFILNVYVVPPEVPCDGDLLWLMLCGW